MNQNDLKKKESRSTYQKLPLGFQITDMVGPITETDWQEAKNLRGGGEQEKTLENTT